MYVFKHVFIYLCVYLLFIYSFIQLFTRPLIHSFIPPQQADTARPLPHSTFGFSTAEARQCLSKETTLQ